jgi:hypothetical protein
VRIDGKRALVAGAAEAAASLINPA